MVETVIKEKNMGSIRSIFMHADDADMFLMILGLIGTIADGISMPVMIYTTSKLINDIGDSYNGVDPQFIHGINQNPLALCYLACGGQLIACFIEGYCWTRTAERQVSSLRAKYLKAALRQDVGYFDFNMTSISEVITTVSSDSLVICIEWMR